MDRNLALEMIRITEAAALASARMMGRGDRKGADQTAVDAMRRAFDSTFVRGTVVIGEGERDEAPMLYIGERVGAGWQNPEAGAPRIDIAVDPLEGTNLCATGQPDSISVIAIADDGQFLNAPDTYMDKIVVGSESRGAIDITRPPAWNLAAVAEAKRCNIEDLTVVILERDRHKQLIADVRQAGARIRLITDGDVAPAVAACKPDTGIDLLMGTGGAPEGVLAAAAVRCMGGDMQGTLKWRNNDEIRRAEKMGIKDPTRVYQLSELAQGQVMFAATGVTDGSLLRGVRFFGGGATTHSVVMRSKSGTIRFIEASHQFETKPNFNWIKK